MINLYALLGFGAFLFAAAFLERWRSNRLDREAEEERIENLKDVMLQPLMEPSMFWDIIERSKKASHNLDDQIRELKKMLRDLSALDIVAFDGRFHACLLELNRFDIWGAIYFLNGGCSDDNFVDFRSWLIGRGRDTFEKVLDDPEAIVDIVQSGHDYWEGLQYCAADVYTKMTGNILPSSIIITRFSEPKGTIWREEDLFSLYPRIAKVLG